MAGVQQQEEEEARSGGRRGKKGKGKRGEKNKKKVLLREEKIGGNHPMIKCPIPRHSLLQQQRVEESCGSGRERDRIRHRRTRKKRLRRRRSRCCRSLFEIEQPSSSPS